jgi:hypothetical protein
MNDPFSQNIETCSEPGLFTPSMPLFANGAPAHDAGRATIRPCLRIPEHPATHSDNIRPLVPEYPATCDAVP